MTIPNAVNKSGPYFYNGATTSFAYGFKISDETHIRVVETVIATGVETDLVLNTDYTVTGVDADAGTVVISPARAAGKSVTLVRVEPFTQNIVLENQGAYFAKVVEGALDASVARDQQLAEMIGRAVIVPVSSDPGDIEELIGGVQALLGNVDDVVTVAQNIVAVQGAAGNAEATAADRIQTGLDRVATAADRIQTGLDRVATAADRVQTGLDRVAAAASAASITPADLVHYTAETNTAARQAQARNNIGLEFGYPLLHVVDEKSIAVNGGTSVAGAQTRTLNTVRTNSIAGASLASDIVTLPEGVYWIEASAPAFQANGHVCYLATSAALATAIIVGDGEYSANATNSAATRSNLSGRLTVPPGGGTYVLRHVIQVGVADNGLGAGAGTVVSILSSLKAWKLK